MMTARTDDRRCMAT